MLSYWDNKDIPTPTLTNKHFNIKLYMFIKLYVFL